MASILSQEKVYFCQHEPFLLSCHYLLSLISRLFCMMTIHYTAIIEDCFALMVVKCTFFTMHIGSLLLDALFKVLYDFRLQSRCVYRILLDIIRYCLHNFVIDKYPGGKINRSNITFYDKVSRINVTSYALRVIVIRVLLQHKVVNYRTLHLSTLATT